MSPHTSQSPPTVLVDPPWNREWETVETFFEEVDRPPFAPYLVWKGAERLNWGEAGGLMERVAREGLSVLSELVDTLAPANGVRAFPFSHVQAALPMAAPDLAEPMLQLYRDESDCGFAAKQWLVRHPEAATVGLLPIALEGEDDCDEAIEAIHFLILSGYRDEVRSGVERFEAEFREAAAPIVNLDPMSLFPEKLPRLPGFASAGSLPRLLLRDGSELPIECTDVFLKMLAISHSYAGVSVVCEACRTDSLAALGRALLSAWLDNGADRKQFWALHAQSALADDQSVRELGALVERWAAEKKRAYFHEGLIALAGVGSQGALLHLHRLSVSGKPPSLRKSAKQMVDRLAQEQGYTADEMADRLFPELGLSEQISLDYGPRSFNLVFSEDLVPMIRTEEGEICKSLPRPNSSDDAEKSGAANERFKTLKRELKSIAKQQIARWEAAMLAARRWTRADFRTLVLEHRLLVELARRIVWGQFDGDQLVATFRICEDNSLADYQDQEYQLSELEVAIPHPVQLQQLKAWQELFNDYQLLQPFPQLQRPTYSLPKGMSLEFESASGQEFAAARVKTLLESDWRQGQVVAAGCYTQLFKDVSCGVVGVEFDPGIRLGGPLRDQSAQTVHRVVLLSREPDDPEPLQPDLAFDNLTPVEFSELQFDLNALRP